MRLEAIVVKIPSRKVTNKDILRFLEEHNNGSSKLLLQKYQKRVNFLLKSSGSEIRYIRDKDNNEKAVTLILDAIKEALKQANLKKGDIDLLIYCGIGKGFLEPANAYFYANAMGMRCSCFDIVDACMSWIRALEISYLHLKNKTHKNIMILNGEFNAYEHGFPENFKIRNLNQVKYTFPTYTIGEASSATIVSAAPGKWSFAYKSVPELCNLCTIAFSGYESYVKKDKKIGKNGTMKFVSYGIDMFSSAEKYLPALMRKVIGDLNKPDLYFPHAASDVAYLRVAQRIGINLDRIFAKVFPTYGNLVSASIPAGICLAREEGLLKRGMNVAFIPASAGMVFNVTQFTY